MARDEFNLSKKDLLAKRVAFRCSNPDCRVLTIGPKEGSEGTNNIGIAAHITAASENGPRYDGTLSHEERKSTGNAIWLCENCAHLIDVEPKKYTVEVLRAWKQQAEEYAVSFLGKTLPEEYSFAKGLSFSLDIFPRNVPPFAFAFEEGSIPDGYLGVNRKDIPFSDSTTWIDRAAIGVQISNLSDTSELILGNIDIETTALLTEYKSGLKYIPQGVKRAIEFIIDLDDGGRTHWVEFVHSQLVNEEKDFFDNGNVVSVLPGQTETILLSFVSTKEPLCVRPTLCLHAGKESAEVPFPRFSTLKIVPCSAVPEEGRNWTIHLDGRASGKGF